MPTDASNWARLRTLKAAEWRVLFAASVLLPGIWIAMRAGAHDMCLRLASRQARRASPRPAPSAEEIARIAALVGVAARRSPAPVTCLSRSIALAWILRRHGVDSELRIGVRMTNGAFDAHAWLERDGVAIGDAPQSGPPFLPFREPIARERAS
jgi:transglutaminase superfamily protein